MTLSSEIILYVFCVLATGFFAGMETGVISMNRLRLLHRARSGSKHAEIISGYLREPDRLLGTTLVGCNLMSVLISTLGTSVAEKQGGGYLVSVAAGITTVVLLLFGEFLPKTWFGSRPLERCVPLARVLRYSEIVFLPFSKLLMLLTSWVRKDNAAESKSSTFITRENLQWLANDSAEGGQISPLERLMIGRVLSLQLKTAQEVMTPLSRVMTLGEDSTLADAAELARESRHLKFPVMNRARTRCIGVLHIEDVMAHITEQPNVPVTKKLRTPFYIRPEVRADDVLPLLRRGRHHLAIVRDRSGHVLGIITLEGILNLIVGKLTSV